MCDERKIKKLSISYMFREEIEICNRLWQYAVSISRAGGARFPPEHCSPFEVALTILSLSLDVRSEEERARRLREREGKWGALLLPSRATQSNHD